MEADWIAQSEKWFGWVNPTRGRKWEYPYVLRWLESLDVKGKRTLDAGCGMSPIAPFCAEWGAYAYAIDSNHQTGKGAGMHPQLYDSLGVAPLIGDFTEMGEFFADGSVDIITYISVAEHLAADVRRAAWDEFKRVLVPGGYLILTLDVHAGPDFRLLNRCALKPVEAVQAHGTLADVEAELQAAGFIPMETEWSPYKNKSSKTTAVGMVLNVEK